MSITYEQAVDDMQTMLNEAWSTTGYQIFWESVESDRQDTNSTWAVSTIRHTSGRQATLGGVGNRMFERRGIIFFQIFTRVGNGLQESYQLAKVISDKFEGRSSPLGVRFKNTRISEVGKDGAFTQTNITIEFEYSETK